MKAPVVVKEDAALRIRGLRPRLSKRLHDDASRPGSRQAKRVGCRGANARLAATRALEATCSACGHPSSRGHSRYERWLADRGVSGREVSIQLRVRRFFCTEPNCARRIFAEQVPGLTERYRRCSLGLRAMLTEVGLALGGRAGALMSRHLNAARSPKTLLRLLRALPVPYRAREWASLAMPNAIDFAWSAG